MGSRAKKCRKDLMESGGAPRWLYHLRTASRGMRLRDWLGTPKQVMLRLVDSYRRDSYKEQRCPRPDGHNCSTVGRRYIATYGALQGTLLALWVVATCGVASECYDNPDAEPCCK